ncbi:beta-ketoacyl-ACP synthase II [bacterium]|nr:beta-ketoacyl-ACP synthase II [bacterium]
MTPRRVVITGIGAVTPLGNSIEEFWEGLKSGSSGINHITLLDASEYSSKIGGEVKNFDPTIKLDHRETKRMDRFCQFAMFAGIEAVEDSGIDFESCDRDRIGVIFGSGIGGMYVFEEQVRNVLNKGPRKISPFFIPAMISDIAAGHLSIRYGLHGPNFSTTSACATSGHAIGCAMRSIRYGESDVMLTGGSEAPITLVGLGGFCAMRALSTRNDAPEKASRPFDKERDGFIIAEGGGIILLEELEHALARKAKIYAEIIGVGFSGDAFHITAPPEDGRGAAKSMLAAIKDGGLELEDIDYINAHGTSTPLNDAAETQAIKTVFGERAKKIPISSIKSMVGHTLGAAGALELISTVLTIKHSIIPPTINYENPDPACDLDYTPNKAIKKEVNAALSNTFGFGGHNASLAVKKYS